MWPSETWKHRDMRLKLFKISLSKEPFFIFYYYSIVLIWVFVVFMIDLLFFHNILGSSRLNSQLEWHTYCKVIIVTWNFFLKKNLDWHITENLKPEIVFHRIKNFNENNDFIQVGRYLYWVLDLPNLFENDLCMLWFYWVL